MTILKNLETFSNNTSSNHNFDGLWKQSQIGYDFRRIHHEYLLGYIELSLEAKTALRDLMKNFHEHEAAQVACISVCGYPCDSYNNQLPSMVQPPVAQQPVFQPPMTQPPYPFQACVSSAILPSLMAADNPANVYYPHTYLAESFRTEYKAYPFYWENLIAWAISLAGKEGINIDNVYSLSISDLLKDSPYVVSNIERCNFAASLRAPSFVVYGLHGEPVGEFACLSICNTPHPIPILGIVRQDGYGKYMPGIRDKMPFIGLDSIPGHDGQSIFVTPSFDEYWLNKTPENDRSILTWAGGAQTLAVLDMTPIRNRGILYSVNPATFFWETKQCLNCARSFSKKAENIGCRVHFLVRNHKKEGAPLECYSYPDDFSKVYDIFDVPVPAEYAAPEFTVIDENVPALTPIVSGFLLEREICVVCGDAGTGKSYFLLTLGYKIAAGEDLNCRYRIAKPRSVLIINGEMNPSVLIERKGVAQKMINHPSERTFVEVIKMTYFNAETLHTDLQRVVKEVNARHPNQEPVSVVVIDSLKTLFDGGDKQNTWNTIFKVFDALRDAGLSFILVHHENKEGDFFGSNDIKVRIDSMFYLTRDIVGIAKKCTPTMSKEAAKALEERAASLQRQLDGSLWFVPQCGKCRNCTESLQKPVALHMNPQAEHPAWGVIDFLPTVVDDSPQERNPEDKSETMGFGEKYNASPKFGDVVLTRDQLYNLPKADLANYLWHFKVPNERKSHQAMARIHGLTEDQSKYLFERAGISIKDCK